MNENFNPFFINSNIVIDNSDLENVESFRQVICNNIGNSYITYSIMKIICGGIYDAPRINNINYFDFNNEKLIDYINSECSHVIFILQDYIRAHALEFPEGLLQFLKKIKKPIIVMSLGSNNYINGILDNNFVNELSNEKIFFLKELSNLTESLGVRGYRTVEALNKLGITNCEPVGCPSYFVRGRNRIVEKKPYDNFKLALGGVLFYTNIDDVSYILQDEFELIEALYFYKRQLSCNFHFNIDYTALAKNKYRSFSNCHKWENYLKDFTMYFGFRMHGAIVSLNAGIPAIATNPDSRAAEMCELFKIPYMPAQLKKPVIDIKFLYDYIDLAPMNRLYNSLYDNFINWLEKFGIKPHTQKSNYKFNYIEQPSLKLQPENIIKSRCIDLLNFRLKIKDDNYISLKKEYETEIINKNKAINKSIEEANRFKESLSKYMLQSNGINILGFSYNSEYFRIHFLFLKITLKINDIAWWIPIRKWRDNFRSKFFDNFIGGGRFNLSITENYILTIKNYNLRCICSVGFLLHKI